MIFIQNYLVILCCIFTFKEVYSDNLVTKRNDEFNSTGFSANLLQELNAQNETQETKIIAEREVVPALKSEAKYADDVRLFLPPDISIIVNAMENLQDEVCKEHILLTLAALNRREKWAMQMLDSSAKFPQSVLTGSYYQMGNYDECTAVRVYENDHNVPRIKGQYCLADVHPNDAADNKIHENMPRSQENSTLHWAICVPHSCKPTEVAYILEFILNGALGSAEAMTVNVSERMCFFESKIPYTSNEMIYGYVIIAFLSIISIATFYHIVVYYQKKDDKMPTGTLAEVVFSFSIINNVKKMLSIGNSSETNLNCICGIKFLSMIFIIAGHTLLFVAGGPTINEQFMKQASRKVENGMFFNNPLMVDTYLLISGFLMCRLLLRELEKRNGRVNFAILYIFRYIRLTPAYFVVIGLYSTWLIRLDEGPLWNEKIMIERDRCQESWWVNLLYINNYLNADHLCMFQSWYLAVDTQLFMLAPLIIYPLWRWKTFGLVFLGTSTLVSVIIPFALTYRDHLDPTFLVFVPEIRDISSNWYFINVYIKTHMRASSYCFGLIFGYLVHKIQSSEYKLSKVSVTLGWIFGTLFGISSMFSIIIFYEPDYEYNALEAGIYSALHRVAWCFGVGWVILACVTNNAGPVQRILSWKPFIPLSRLTYCAYLANGLVELHNSGTVRQPKYMSIYELASTVLAHIMLTFTIALILCILFESPIHGFERILLKKDSRRKSIMEAQPT